MNIEEIGTPYPVDRRGIRATTGPSGTTAPSNFATFDHYNIWVPGAAFQNQVAGSCTVLKSSTVSSFRLTTRVIKSGEGHYDVYHTLRRPRFWDEGILTGRIWYTGVGAANKHIGMHIEFKLWEEGGTGGTANSFSDDTPAPSSDGELMIFRVDLVTFSFPSIDASSDLIAFGINARDAIDGALTSYEEDVELIGAELIFRPSAGGSTSGVDPWLMKP